MEVRNPNSKLVCKIDERLTVFCLNQKSIEFKIENSF